MIIQCTFLQNTRRAFAGFLVHIPQLPPAFPQIVSGFFAGCCFARCQFSPEYYEYSLIFVYIPFLYRTFPAMAGRGAPICRAKTANSSPFSLDLPLPSA